MNASTGNETDVMAVSTDAFVSTAIIGSYCVFIMIGNGMTIASVLRFEQLRTPTNIFVASLAGADFTFGMIGPFYTFLLTIPAGIHLSHTTRTACLFSLWGVFFSTLGSVFNLLAIAVDRYIAITLPLRYGAVVTMTTAYAWTAVIWSVNLCLSLPPVLGWNRWSGDSLCDFSEVLHVEYTVCLFAVPVVVCLCVLTVLYCVVFAIAVKHQRQIQAEQSSANYSAVKAHLKSTKIMCIVLGAFYVCWLPYIAMSGIVALRGPNISKLLQGLKRLTAFLVLMNSGVNPCIYAWRNAEFKKAYKQLLRFT